jgi:hypothetical protein
MSCALVTELGKYRGELESIIEQNTGRVDFARVKAEICQRFSGVSLSPLDSHVPKQKRAGNSAGTRERERDTDAFNVSTVVS